MDARQLLDELSAELSRHRLPRAYIKRFMDELRDHMDDLEAERSLNMNAARMPDADVKRIISDSLQLAKITAEQYHRRSFLGRHPILTFVIAPLPLVVLAWSLLLLTLGVFFLWPVKLSGYTIDLRQDPWLTSIGYSILGWAMIVLPLIGADLLLCRIARRNALGWGWSVTACAFVALLCSLFWTLWIVPMQITTVGDKPYEGQFIMCFGWPAAWRTVVRYAANFAWTLGIGLLLVWRAYRQVGIPHDDPTVELRQAA